MGQSDRICDSAGELLVYLFSLSGQHDEDRFHGIENRDSTY